MDDQIGEPQLRRLGDGSGVGFCYEIDRRLFASAGAHGPLLVAWDSNVLIDFHTYGAAVLNDEPLPESDLKRVTELYALADLINLWMIRDIRFLVLPRGEQELGETTVERRLRNQSAIEGLAEALTFQLEDWGANDWRDEPGPEPLDKNRLAAFPDGADRELVAQAIRHQVDVFLTQDRKILRARAAVEQPLILSPRELVDRLDSLGIELYSGGLTDHVGCPYADALPAPDMGRWGPLLAALEI